MKRIVLLAFFATIVIVPASFADAVAELKAMGITAIDEAQLFSSIDDGNAKAVKLLIAAGLKPNLKDSDGRTPLGEAVAMQRPEVVATLLAAGADPKDPANTGLVMRATSNGDIAIVRSLLAAGAPVDTPDEQGVTPLAMSARVGNPELVKLFIESKADVNHAMTGGYPVLSDAVGSNNPQVVALLIAAGAKFGSKKKDIIEMAATSGNAEIRELVGKAAGTKVPRKATREGAMPVVPKKVTPATAREAYDIAEKVAAHWQADAGLTELTALDFGADGKAKSWSAHFNSPTAKKSLLMDVENGAETHIEVPGSDQSEYTVRVSSETIFDTPRLNTIANEAGGAAYTSRNAYPSVALTHNPTGGDLWYFNYSDPDTRRVTLSIIIDANHGNVVMKDAH